MPFATLAARSVAGWRYWLRQYQYFLIATYFTNGRWNTVPMAFFARNREHGLSRRFRLLRAQIALGGRWLGQRGPDRVEAWRMEVGKHVRFRAGMDTMRGCL
jgi:hypothetical protein